MRTIEYQYHLEQNFAHYTREITVHVATRDVDEINKMYHCWRLICMTCVHHTVFYCVIEHHIT